MKQRPAQGHARTTAIATFAIALALLLSGCEMPAWLEGVLGPIDSLLTPTSVEEAQNAQRAAKSPTVSAPAIHEDGTLVVGIKAYTSSAPLVITESDGSVMGIDVDVASAIADEMGLSVRFVVVNDVDEALAGSCDVVMGAEVGESSRATVVGRYSESAPALFRRGGSGIVSVSDLTGATVGLQDGSVSQRVLSESNAVMAQVPYPNLNEAFEALEAGSVEYVLCDAYPGAYLASLYGDITVAGTLEVASPIGIAVAADNATLQAAVQSAYDAVSTGGVVDLVRAKWVGGLASLTADDVVAGLSSVGDAIAQAGDDQGQAASLVGAWVGSVQTSSGTEDYFTLTLEDDGTVTLIPVDAHYYDFYNQDGTYEQDGSTVLLHLSRGEKTVEVQDADTLTGAGSDFGLSGYDTITFARQAL